MRIGVVHEKFANGVYPPGYRREKDAVGQTYDWRCEPGSPGNTARIKADVESIELVDALTRVYHDDAYGTIYAPRANPDKFPRFNKPSMPWAESEGIDLQVSLLFVDCDRPGKADVSAGWFYDQVARIRRVYPHCGIFATRHGLRIVQPLLGPVPAGNEAEDRMSRMFTELESVGVAPDRKTKDWTRLSGLPNTLRRPKERTPFLSPAILLDDMEPVAIEPLCDGSYRDEKTGKPRISGPLHFSDEIPERWETLIAPLVHALSVSGYQERRHDIFLSLAGALVNDLCAPYSIVPSLIRSIAERAGMDGKHHHGSAMDTVTRWANGVPIRGVRYLSNYFPEIVDAASDLFGSAALLHEEEVATKRAEERPPEMTHAEISQRMYEVIKNAPWVVTCIAAQPGQGKTREMVRVISERALSQAKRKPKSAISLPTNDLAIEVTERLRAQGIAVRRVFGVLSVVNADGSPACAYHRQAAELARGGLSVPYELCHGRGIKANECPNKATCPAMGGLDEDDKKGTVTVGTHSSLDRLVGYIGSHGLLCIDEPPWELETLPISMAELQTADRARGFLEEKYAGAMRPAIHAAMALLRNADIDINYKLAEALDAELPNISRDALQSGVSQVGEHGSVIDYATLALEPNKPQGPPVVYKHIWKAANGLGVRNQETGANESMASLIGTAARVFGLLRRALLEPLGAVAFVSLHTVGKSTTRVLSLTVPNARLVKAIKSDRPTIMADASIRLHMTILEKFLEYKPTLHEYVSGDGAEITRVHVLTRAASKKVLCPGRTINHAAVAHLLRAAADLHVAGQRTILITYKWLEDLLRDPPADGPVAAQLSRFNPPVDLAHYGAIRGKDIYRDHDAVINLGDPRPNIAVTRREVDYLALGESADDRNAALARAEAQQAAGRIRPKHRIKPGTMVHVGEFRPDDWLTEKTRVIQLRGQRSITTGEPLTADGLRGLIDAFGGSAREFSEAAKIPWGTTGKYLGEEARAIPPHHAAAFRAVLPLAADVRKAPGMSNADFRRLVDHWGGQGRARRRVDCPASSMSRYYNGQSRPPQAVVDGLLAGVGSFMPRSTTGSNGMEERDRVYMPLEPLVERGVIVGQFVEASDSPVDSSLPGQNDTTPGTDPDPDERDHDAREDSLSDSDTSFDPSQWVAPVEGPALPSLALLSDWRARSGLGAIRDPRVAWRALGVAA